MQQQQHLCWTVASINRANQGKSLQLEAQTFLHLTSTNFALDGDQFEFKPITFQLDSKP